ncbi:DnaB-like helicase C-terminal domain-containing protein [Chthonobacter rhizosphaerae]|uniref:DnaB-like helicase C-terminal domain-containing protein n=1 Tax=Chthonobacter rhizosphaerae TaxID=2735553 RepID=UPI0015EE5768|nr:DnaB-like helicase C-terminal domain-containing protein [Chthonobacter rhizosphaerae]
MILDDIEIEQILLGGLLRDSDKMLHCPLKPEDFSAPPHQELFAKMKAILSEKGVFEPNDFAVWARGKTFADDGDGIEYIRALTRATLSPDVPGLSAQIAEFAAIRRLDGVVDEAKAKIVSGQPASDIAGWLKSQVENGSNAEGVKSAISVYEEIALSLERPAEHFSTGLARLDRVMGGGLYAGFTYGFCGAEKMGKTTLAHSISYNLSCPHLYVALEMGSAQIEARNVARDIGVNSLAFLGSPGIVKQKLAQYVPQRKVHYLDAPGACLREILDRVSGAILRHEIKGFIIDYWQLVGGQSKGDTEEKHLRYVAQGFADFARKNKVWCILMAQMNKDGHLFGGNGLRKACDQLFMIEKCETEETGRWLRMDASRYTMRTDIGNENAPGLRMNTTSGPFFEDA